MAMVTSSIVSSNRLTMASGVGGVRTKCMPRNSGGCEGAFPRVGRGWRDTGPPPCRKYIEDLADPLAARLVPLVAERGQRGRHEAVGRIGCSND